MRDIKTVLIGNVVFFFFYGGGSLLYQLGGTGY